MGVSTVVTFWERYLESYPRKPWFSRLWAMLHGTKYTPYFQVVVTLNMFLYCLQKKFPDEFGEAFRGVLANYSALCSQIIFTWKKTSLMDTFRRAGKLEREMAKHCDAKSLSFTSDYERISSSYSRTMIGYTIVIAHICFLAESTVGGFVPAAIHPASGLALRGFFLVQAVAAVLIIVPYCVVTPFICATIGACIALYKVLGRLVESSKSAEEYRQLIIFHQELNSIASTFRESYSLFFLNHLSVALALPLLILYDYWMGYQVGLSILAIITVIAFFVPVCIVGQLLINTSRHISTQVYCSNWINEERSLRKCKLMTMLRSTKANTLSVSGLGVLNHTTCRVALRTWLSYLQMLINLS